MSPSYAHEDEARTIIVVVFLTAIAGILYELSLGTISSLLFGDSVLEWSLTVGIFLAAMGLGSFASGRVEAGLERMLVVTQLVLALVGAVSPLCLFATFALAPYLLRGLLVVVLLVLGFGIGLEIPLLTRLLRRGGGTLRSALAYVLAVDYIGALAASLAFPLLLYPALGLVRTAFVTALLNVASAIGLVRVYGGTLASARSAKVGIACTGILLACGVVLSAYLGRFVSRAIYSGEIVWSEQSRYQTIALTSDAGSVSLYLNGQLQFNARDEARYHEALVHPAMSLSPTARRVLVLGGGDGLAVREILRHPSVTHVVLVDLDPAVVRLSREHDAVRALNENALRDPRVHVRHEDAMRFSNGSAERAPFDVIVLDLPDPSTPGLARLYAVEFYKLLIARLAPSGTLVTQATSPYFTRQSFWCIERTLSDAGLVTRPYHLSVPSFGEWGFVLASHAPKHLPARPVIDTDYLEPPHWAALFDFPPDMARVEARSSTIVEPVLASYYATEHRRETN